VGDFSLDSLEASVMEFISLSLVVETLKPEQFLEVRFAHELLCAETAARRRTAASIEKLEQIHGQIVVAFGESRAAFELDLQFHRALAEATLNPLILSIEGALIAVLHRMIGDAAQTTPDETLANLTEIFEAVRDGRPDAAREAMRRHLSQTAIHYGFESNGASAGASWIATR
jgi:GntR family transcriptional repressor for pyruvate dehydrogenase complex